VVFVAPGREASVRLDGDAGRLVVVTRPGPDAATTRVLVEHYAWGIDDTAHAANQARLDAAADALGRRPPGTTAADRSTRPADRPTDRPTSPQEGPMSAAPYVPDGSPALIPYLCCKDAASAIDFYVDAFGATETSPRFVDGDGKVGHAELEVGGSPFYVSDEYPDMGVEAPAPGRSGASFCVYVPDVDASVARATARGATVLEPAEEKFYGTRRSTIEDPFGHRWLVGTHVRDVGKDEYQQAVDDFANT
jgi:PhnB protein